jgi:putative resolvase
MTSTPMLPTGGSGKEKALPVPTVRAEVAAGLPGQRRLLTDPKVTAMVVDDRDQLARMNVDLIRAASAADGCPLVAGR